MHDHEAKARTAAGANSAPESRLEPIEGFKPAAGGFIDDAIRVRDLHQFEIKLHYPLNRDRSTTSYDLECYIFVPHSLGIHRANYSKARFYDDLQTYIRFKTPAVSLTRIAGAEEGALAKLAASAIPLQDAKDDSQVGLYEYRLKLFCCIFRRVHRQDQRSGRPCPRNAAIPRCHNGDHKVLPEVAATSGSAHGTASRPDHLRLW